MNIHSKLQEFREMDKLKGPGEISEQRNLRQLKGHNETEIQRYTYKKLIINMSILFCLILVLNSMIAEFQTKYKSTCDGIFEININSVKTSGDKTIKYKHIKSMKNLALEKLSFFSEKESYVNGGNSGYTVNTVLCGENFIDFIDIFMLKGTFLSKEQHELGKEVVVISENLAHKLFMTNNVLGNKVSIDGVTYTVVGVYEQEVTPFSILYSDGVERIYIPFESDADYKKQTINTVFIKDKRFQETAFGTESVKELLKRVGVESSKYKIKDYKNSNIYVAQPLSTFILFVGVLIILMLFRYFVSFIKDGFAFFRRRLKEGYPLEVMAGEKLRIFVFITGAALLLASMGAIYWTVRFKGSVPYQYIPPENIFDFEFYRSLIKSGIYEANRATGYIPTHHELWLNINLVFSYALTLCILIAFVSVRSCIKLYRITGGYSDILSLKVLLYSLLTGAAVAFLICVMSGLQIAFPVTYIAIMVIYSIGKLFNKSQKISNYLFS